jgi:SAM-dependent methyltransferase
MAVDKHLNTWKDADVAAHWDGVAHKYVAENNKVKDAHDQRFLFAIEHLQLKPRAQVLNISSRDAEAAEYIRKFDKSILTVNAEISGKLMHVANQIRPWVTQVKIDTYSQLPFMPGIYDRILSLETLEHVENPIAFLSELHRIAKPGAIMVLSCPPLTSEWPYRIFTFLFGGHGEGPHRFLRSREVSEMLAKTGWQLLLHKGTLLLPVGPRCMKRAAEWFINTFQNTFVSELGIRQFYVCKKI